MMKIGVILLFAIASAAFQITDVYAAPTKAECDAADAQIRKAYAIQDMRPQQKAEAQRAVERANAVLRECRNSEMEAGMVETRKDAAEKAKAAAERAADVQAQRQAAIAAAAAECDRRGQPRIGMTSDQLIETCWRTPIHIVRRTTAAGLEENFIYSGGRAVKISNGMVSEITGAR